MSRRYMTRAEHNAILAGLLALQERLLDETVGPFLDEIMTCDDVDAIDAKGVDDLIYEIQFDEVQLHVEEDEDEDEDEDEGDGE